ncbi:MAG: tetratricopeptide repeat protein [Bacteroidota bacterium]
MRRLLLALATTVFLPSLAHAQRIDAALMATEPWQRFLNYASSEGVPNAQEDYATAVSWYRVQADAGDQYAQYALGVYHDALPGIRPDYEQALYWYEQAATQNYIFAQYDLADLYREGLGTPQDLLTAAFWYRQAGEQGHLPSQFQLGRIFEDLGDPAEAAQWYARPADAGDPFAQYHLGQLFASGRGVPFDVARADDLLQRSARQGYVEAHFALGELMRDLGRYRDAASWYQLPAEQGNPFALYHLGFFAREGLGMDINLEQAETLLRLSAEQEYLPAWFALGETLEARGEHKEAARWYTRPADAGDQFAQYRLGQLHEQGLGVRRNWKRAAEWYQRAAEQGYVTAYFALGQLYEYEEQYADAARWYQRPAEQGDSFAQHRLGYLYENGLGVAQDLPLAEFYYAKSAEQNYPYAQEALGRMLASRALYSEAAGWYLQAARQGYDEAQFQLGQLYALGRGVPRNPQEALRWYRLAARNGSSAAQQAVTQMQGR